MATVTNSRQVAETRQELDAVGMPPVDGQVYATLIRHPRASAAELAEQCGLSVHQVSRALSRLTAGGMTSRAPGRPARYLAGAPDVALSALLAAKEAELRAARSTVDQLMEVFREASRFTHPAELVEVVMGNENITHRFGHLQDSARSQIRGFDKPPYVKAPGQNLGDERRRLIDGVRYRVIYDREAVAWPGRLENDILVSCAQGELARVRPVLPMKMIIADDREAIIPISSSLHVMDAAYVIHPSALLDALATLFEAEWGRAVPLAQAVSRGAVGRDEPDEEVVALLTLLAAGQTDEGIGRALGWSPRTTQRRVRQLMDELNATTRFQAGMAAKERGWL
jgi:DNA-binding transcriptional regulator GbsR (MarR family)